MLPRSIGGTEKMILLDLSIVFLVSALAGMGVGGGGLPVLFFTAVRHFPQKSAQGLSIVLFIAAAIGAYTVNRKKRKLDLGIIPYVAFSGCIFAFFGAAAVEYVPSAVLRKLFGGLLVLTGIYTVFKKDKHS